MMLNEHHTPPAGTGCTSVSKSPAVTRPAVAAMSRVFSSERVPIIPLPRPTARRNASTRHSVPDGTNNAEDEGYKQSVLIATGQAYSPFLRSPTNSSAKDTHSSLLAHAGSPTSHKARPVTVDIDSGYQPFVPAGDPDRDRIEKRRLSQTVAVAATGRLLSPKDKKVSEEMRQILSATPELDMNRCRVDSPHSSSSSSFIEETLLDEEDNEHEVEKLTRSMPPLTTNNSNGPNARKYDLGWAKQVARIRSRNNANGTVGNNAKKSIMVASGPNATKKWDNEDEDNLLEGDESDQDESSRPPRPVLASRGGSHFSPPIPPRKHTADSKGNRCNPQSREGDLWSMSAEQKEYYSKQFHALQRTPSGKLTGPAAREFFEKSKLHQVELSNIWRLSDVDADGCLTVDEFCTAMHLVVLRRHGVIVPRQLPASLRPAGYNPAINVSNTLKAGYVGSPPVVNSNGVEVQKSISAPLGLKSQPLTCSPESGSIGTVGVVSSTNSMSSPREETWTKFNDDEDEKSMKPSTTSNLMDIPAPNSSIPAPLMPAHRPSASKLVHPLPFRLSPDGRAVVHHSLLQHANQPRNHTIPGPNQRTYAFKPLSLSEKDADAARRSSLAEMATNGTAAATAVSAVTLPPPPQVTVIQNHARSWSLDLNPTSRVTSNGHVSRVVIRNSSSDYVNMPSLPAMIGPSETSAFKAYKEQHPNKSHGNPRPAEEILLMSLTEEDEESKVPIHEKVKTETISTSASNSKPWLEMLMIKYRLPERVPRPSDVHDRGELLKTIEAWEDRSREWDSIFTEMRQELISSLESKQSLESQLELLKQ